MDKISVLKNLLRGLKDAAAGIINRTKGAILGSGVQYGKNDINPTPPSKTKLSDNLVPDVRAGNLKRLVLAQTNYKPQARINLTMLPVGLAKSDKAPGLNNGTFGGVYDGSSVQLSNDTLNNGVSSDYATGALRHEFAHASDYNINPGTKLDIHNLGDSSGMNENIQSNQVLRNYIKTFLGDYKGKGNPITRDVETYAEVGALPDIMRYPRKISDRYSGLYNSLGKNVAKN